MKDLLLVQEMIASWSFRDYVFAPKKVMNLLEKIYAADRLGLLAVDEARGASIVHTI